MAKIKNGEALRFQDAIDSCPEIRGKIQKGLSALGSNSKAVRAGDTKLIDGSLDIDKAVRVLYPNDSRWDYVIGYSGEAIFIEVHPADTKNVDEMVGKVSWLKDWLVKSAPELRKLHRNGYYYWIPSGRVKISKGSTQFKKIAANHLQIKKQVIL